MITSWNKVVFFFFLFFLCKALR